MSSPHSDPSTHGQQFGRVVVTIDLDAFDCVLRAPGAGRGLRAAGERVVRLHSLDEVREAFRTQNWLSRKPEEHPHAADMARALKFAGLRLEKHQEKSRNVR